MKEALKISIIIPIYRVEKYLCQCIDSVLDQSYRNLEIILVDDGSDDSCPFICDRYAQIDPRIRVLHKKNGGLSDARNAGLDLATGDYIGFVDSDDWISLSMYEDLVSIAETEKADVACCSYIRLDDATGKKVEEMRFQGTQTLSGPEAVKAIFYKQPGNVVVWNKIYRSHLFRHVRFPVGQCHEDSAVLCPTMGQAERVAFTETIGYFYRLRQGSIMQSGNADKHRRDLEKVKEEIQRWVDRHCVELISAFHCYEVIISVLSIKFYLNEENHDNTGMIRALSKALNQKLFMYLINRNVPIKRKLEALLIGSGAYRAVRSVWRVLRKRRAEGEKLIRVFSRFFAVLRYPFDIRDAGTVLFNSPRHGNLGDHAIALAELEFCTSQNIRMFDFPWLSRFLVPLALLTPRNKQILINGGGYLGSLWKREEKRTRRIIKAFRNHDVLIYPQTVYFDLTTEKEREFCQQSRKCYSGHPSMTLFVREKNSFDFIRKEMPAVSVKMVPDMAMLLEGQKAHIREGVLLCLRNDKEKTMKDEEKGRLLEWLRSRCRHIKITDTVMDEGVSPRERETAVRKKMMEFSGSELVITDRLHGMIFAAVTETPCIVLNSRSYKVKGCYEWFRDLDYIRFAETVEEIPVIMDDLKHTHPVYRREKIENAMMPLKRELQAHMQKYYHDH